MKNSFRTGMWSIIFLLGLVWVRSGFEKIHSGTFPANLAKTLTYFASKNPYPWFKPLLLTVAIPQSRLIGMCVQWSELLTGVVLTLGTLLYFFVLKGNRLILAIVLIALLVSAAMNTFFWLAAGWTGPSADDLNLFMIGVAAILFVTLLFQQKLSL